jgi:hypothetical protein
MSKVFNFRSSLKQGKDAELEFKNLHPYLNLQLEQTNDFDFTMISDGELKKVELKTDFHVSDNFFFEYYSCNVKKSPGSLWQSDIKHVDWFIYWFKKTNEIYVFDLREILPVVEKLIKDKNLKTIQIKNSTHTSEGYLIKKTLLQDYMFEIDPELVTQHQQKQEELKTQKSKEWTFKVRSK